MKVWLNGGLVDESDALVSVFDHGLTVGDGVFETLRTYGGRPFAVRRHLERLASSAAGLGLTGLPPAAVLRTALDEVAAAALAGARPPGASAADPDRPDPRADAGGPVPGPPAEVALRITVTTGPGPLGSTRGALGPTVVVAARALPPRTATVAVAVAPWPRNERSPLVGLKTTSYGENAVALAFARERGAGEAILANLAGHLCEGTGSNVVVAVGGRLVTPPRHSGCLAGVTRALVIEACGVEEADLPLSALAEAPEAFLTSTTREVQPISAVDGRPLPAAPGPLTTAAAAAYTALTRADPDP